MNEKKETWLKVFLESKKSSRTFVKEISGCPFSYKTLDRLKIEFKKNGMVLPDRRSLVRAKHRPTFPEIALYLCKLVLDQGILSKTSSLIQQLLRLAEPTLEISVGSIPSLRTIDYYLLKIKNNEEIVTCNQQAKEQAKLLLEAFVRQEILEINRCWAIDSQQFTKADQKKTGLYLGDGSEPWIIRVVDLASRRLLAQLVCQRKPTVGLIIAAIHAAALKAATKPGHARLPDYIRVDRGLEHLPLVYRSGITFRFVQFTPRATPANNGTVEAKHSALCHHFIPRGLILPRMVTSEEYVELVERGGKLNSQHPNRAFNRQLTPDEAARNLPHAGSELLLESLDQKSYVIQGPFHVRDEKYSFRGDHFLIPSVSEVIIHEYVAGNLKGKICILDKESMTQIPKEGICYDGQY